MHQKDFQFSLNDQYIEHLDIADDELRFGDEVECGIFVVDSATKSVRISLRGAEVLCHKFSCRFFLIMLDLKILSATEAS